MTAPTRIGDISFWYADIGLPTPRPPLQGDTTADVCIIGAGEDPAVDEPATTLRRPIEAIDDRARPAEAGVGGEVPGPGHDSSSSRSSRFRSVTRP